MSTNLLSIVASFHNDMKAKVQFHGNPPNEFQNAVGVKQGCVLAPTLFEIYLSSLPRFAFGSTEEGVFLRMRPDGSLFNIQRLRANSKWIEFLVG